VRHQQTITLARGADLPVHFSNGVLALSTREGQACASLADLLMNGLSQDRVRRLFDHGVGHSRHLKKLSRGWAVGISPDAGLFQVDHWRRALAEASTRGSQEQDLTAIVMSALEILVRGVDAAEEAGAEFLAPSAQLLWQRALKSAPADAMMLSLQQLRLTDDSEAGTSIAWCPAMHLVGAPRPHVWLLGLTSGTWPRKSREDPLLSDHLLSRKILDPDPIGNRQRRAFELIRAGATAACMISYSRRSAQGGNLPASPLIATYPKATLLRRGRVPQHAFSETDRLLARPQDAVKSPQILSALGCWSDWSVPRITAHDGLVREHHPVIERVLQQTQSATSLALLLRDPLAFVWRYALGWLAPATVEEPLSLDARVWGELVHELLRRAVDRLEPDPGYTRASPEALQNALRLAASEVAEQWPLERPIPPPLLWQHTLAHAEDLAFKALTRDESFSPGTRCWTEVPFGSALPVPGDWPWDVASPVLIPGTKITIRGSIDRLDRNASATAVRVTDYKTGFEPSKEPVVVSGGALQRVIYAIAATQLVPDAQRVVARLFYLREDTPREHKLDHVRQAIEDLSGYIQQGCTLLAEGKTLPPLARDEYEDFRLALPAERAYFKQKVAPIRKAFGVFARIWGAP
jgi:hypothetical protein